MNLEVLSSIIRDQELLSDLIFIKYLPSKTFNAAEIEIHHTMQLKLYNLLKNFIDKVKNHKIQEYEYDLNVKDTYSTLNVNETVNIKEFYENFIQLTDIEPINTLSNLTKMFNVYVIVCEYEDNGITKRIIGIKKIKPRYLLKDDKIFLVKKFNRFKLEEEPVFTIEPDFDCIIFNNDPKILVFHTQNFESIFNYKEVIIKKIKEFTTTIENIDFIKGWEYTENIIISNTHYIRKLARVIRRKIYEEIDMNKLTNANKEYKLDIPIIKNKIIIPSKPTKKQIYQILKALNDDFTKSITTERVYSIEGSKEELD